MENSILKHVGNEAQFARFGKNSIGYIRRVRSEDFNATFPGASDLPTGLDLWGLFDADGEPIALADEELAIRTDARERDLLAVYRH